VLKEKKDQQIRTLNLSLQQQVSVAQKTKITSENMRVELEKIAKQKEVLLEALSQREVTCLG
jgi:hypothetical protein